MARLYPPYVEGTIPAFYGRSITVPFAMNYAVGKSEISGFSLLIKTIQTGQQIEAISSASYDLDNGVATFNITSTSYQIGQSYKVQLAYKDKFGVVGYYSTVAVVKYTSAPSIEIEGLGRGVNKHKYNYIGRYSTSDITEKMYSCQFKVYDQDKNLFLDTGEIIHNSLNDEAPKSGVYEATEAYTLNRELESGKNYYIQFLVKTIGLMELDTGLYQIVQGEPIPLGKTIAVVPSLNYDNGYIDVVLRARAGAMTGHYVLCRACSKTNFKVWDEIMRFNLSGATEKEVWKDFTIEHGYYYKYGIFMIDSENNYSQRMESDTIMADFEDMFLFDGDKQLCIKFNPKVSSFKYDLQEQKTDTIGGKFPYFFRNGNVKYREFPLSGLISHLSDDEGYFQYAAAQKKVENNLDENTTALYTTNLNTENFIMEREFKMEVLDWLTDGKLKLFRSPAEGNYIVHLMNTSLSPTDSLGRMLHTFSCTAYEAQEYTHENLVASGIIKNSLLVGVDPLQIKVRQRFNNWDDLEKIIKSVGSITGIKFDQKSGKLIINGKEIDLSISNSFTSWIIDSIKDGASDLAGWIDYITDKIPNINNDIKDITTVDVPAIQFKYYSDFYDTNGNRINLLTSFLSTTNELSSNNTRDYISQIFSIKCTGLPENWIKKKDDGKYYRLSSDEEITIDKNNIYLLHNQNNAEIGYLVNGDTTIPKSEGYKLKIKYKDNREETKTIEKGKTIELSNLDEIKELYGSIGLDIVMSCRLGRFNGSVTTKNEESENDILNGLKDGIYKTANELKKALEIIKEWWNRK